MDPLFYEGCSKLQKTTKHSSPRLKKCNTTACGYLTIDSLSNDDTTAKDKHASNPSSIEDSDRKQPGK